MFLLNSLSLLLDGRGNDDGHAFGSSANSSFPAGRLTSAAWEGWWHEEQA
ncbi:hypothetical protein ACRB8A_08960 [Arthrobacter sp. G.S.26]